MMLRKIRRRILLKDRRGEYMKRVISRGSVRASLFLLMLNLFIVMTAIGLVIPILSFYVKSFGASAQTLGWLVASYSIMQFLSAPFWGRWSDIYGRKPILVVGMIGFCGAEFLFAFANSIWMLFASRFVAGLFGTAIMPAAMAYVGDVTADEERTKGMGFISASMGLGIVVGPAVGGWLSNWGIRVPFFVAGFAALGAAIFTFFLLKESLTKEEIRNNRKQETPKFIHQIRAAAKSCIGPLFIFLLIMSFGLANFQSIFSFYAMEQLNLSATSIGWIFLWIGLVGVLVQIFSLERLIKKFGQSVVVTSAFLIGGVAFLFLTFFYSLWVVVIATGLFSVSNALLRPALNTLVSRMTKQKQGETMGLSNGAVSLGNVLGPIVASQTYTKVAYGPFIIGSIVMFTMPYFVLRWKKKYVKPKYR